MDFSTIAMLAAIGLAAGMLGGFIGVGGGVIIVPGLIYFLGMSQHGAQGTSLALMLPPIGILAFINYYKAGVVDLRFAAIIALAFIIGGYFGSKLSLKMDPQKVKFAFGLLMLYVSINLIWRSSAALFGNNGA